MASSSFSASLRDLDSNAALEPLSYPYPWNRFTRAAPSTSSYYYYSASKQRLAGRALSRPRSVSSTSSICSDDSSLADTEHPHEEVHDDDEQEQEQELEQEYDEGDDDSDADSDLTETESLFSVPTPTTLTSCSSWSAPLIAYASSCPPPPASQASSSDIASPTSPIARFSRAEDKPRGPRSRPLPQLPTISSPSSPSSPTITISPPVPSKSAGIGASMPTHLPSARPHTSYNPRSETHHLTVEPLAAKEKRRPQTSPSATATGTLSFGQSLRIAQEEDYIDWNRVEDFLCLSDG